MEIERKYLIPDVNSVPYELSSLKSHLIEQAYLCTSPVVRVRRSDDSFYMTYKGGGLMVREEYNLPLTEDAYSHLAKKADGNLITKRRYLIPIENDLTIELDVFLKEFAPLVLAEVEFPDEETANSFTPPSWFGEDVTFTSLYHNSTLSSMPKEAVAAKAFFPQK